MNMNWLGFVEQVMGGELAPVDGASSWELVDDSEVSYDEHGLTVVADMDGDGLIDRVSRMDYSGSSCTIDLSEWGISQGELAHPLTPEMGTEKELGTSQSAGWGVDEWG